MPRKKQATVTQPVPVVFPVDGKTIFTTFDTTIQRHLIVCDNCGITITLSLTRLKQEADDQASTSDPESHDHSVPVDFTEFSGGSPLASSFSHPTTTTSTPHPNSHPNHGHPAIPRPSPLQRDVGLSARARQRDMGAGTQEVGGPAGASRT